MVLEQIPQAIHLTKQTSVIEIQAQRFPEQRFYSKRDLILTYHQDLVEQHRRGGLLALKRHTKVDSVQRA
jgi:exodeoxyribonuclease V beta subunit